MNLLLRLLTALCSLLAMAGCTTSHQPPPTTYAPPIGKLGNRLGTLLHVEGMRADAGKVGSSTLRVDTVNGTVCDPPCEIWLDNLSLPVGIRCQLSGFESGRWIGIPPEVSQAEGTPQQQAMWQFQVFFVVTSIQGPDSLRTANHTLAR